MGRKIRKKNTKAKKIAVPHLSHICPSHHLRRRPEIMRDAQERVGKLIIDCHPRLVEMFKRSFPKADVYGTRKQLEISWWTYGE